MSAPTPVPSFPARGCLIGLVLGLLMWAALIAWIVLVTS